MLYKTVSIESMATLFASEVSADILLKSDISDNKRKALREHSIDNYIPENEPEIVPAATRQVIQSINGQNEIIKGRPETKGDIMQRCPNKNSITRVVNHAQIRQKVNDHNISVLDTADVDQPDGASDANQSLNIITDLDDPLLTQNDCVDQPGAHVDQPDEASAISTDLDDSQRLCSFST
ncbi:hypothetical protein H2202_009887 [Exophiala xenobiotica]|nr:hypothetical protein H2202_009887 [Exophiala xenobiotica]